jgi:hypothetical protein
MHSMQTVHTWTQWTKAIQPWASFQRLGEVSSCPHRLRLGWTRRLICHPGIPIGTSQLFPWLIGLKMVYYVRRSFRSGMKGIRLNPTYICVIFVTLAKIRRLVNVESIRRDADARAR